MAKASISILSTGKDKTRHKILVVDDDESVRRSLDLLLTAEGYEVFTGVNGFDGLLQIKRNMPDIITSDLNMPQMSGFEFLSVVRRRFPTIPVIAISGAFSSPDAVPRGILADAFYAKGQHDPTVLLKIIADLIQTADTITREHEEASAPVWIPHNGKDSNGIPYIVLTCTECLRSFPLSVSNEGNNSNEIQETPCVFCLNLVKYIIDFSESMVSPRRKQVTAMFARLSR
jgi:CheY-like chemotaxis protein